MVVLLCIYLWHRHNPLNKEIQIRFIAFQEKTVFPKRRISVWPSNLLFLLIVFLSFLDAFRKSSGYAKLSPLAQFFQNNIFHSSIMHEAVVLIGFMTYYWWKRVIRKLKRLICSWNYISLLEICQKRTFNDIKLHYNIPHSPRAGTVERKNK